jgi:hypothetical protein
MTGDEALNDAMFSILSHKCYNFTLHAFNKGLFRVLNCHPIIIILIFNMHIFKSS